MRVTESMRLTLAQISLDKANAHQHELTVKASTGLEVGKPSDGPAAFASIVRRSGEMARMKSRQNAVERSLGDLEVAESALASGSDIMIRAREIAVQMADGVNSAEERANAAIEIDTLREQLMAVANTRGSRGYLFGGSATDTAPIDGSGAFVGNDAQLAVEYAKGQTMAANVSGASAFTSLNGGLDVFAELDNLSAALNADDANAVHNMIDVMDDAHQQLVTARGDAGVRIDRLGAAAGVLESALVVATEQQADEQNIDPHATYVDLANAQSALERTLAVTRQILSMTSALERF